MYQFDFSVVWSNMDYLLRGAATTLYVSVVAVLLGTVLGTLAAICRSAKSPPVRIASACYIETFRATPLLAQLYIIIFGLPAIGILLAPLHGAIVGLTLYTGAYTAEILRAGLAGVPAGQHMAARALAFPRWAAFRRIIFPQAMRNSIPALGNQVIDTTQSSSLLYIIGAPELTQHAASLASQEFRPIEVYLVVGAMYLVLAIVLSWTFAGIANTFGRKGRKSSHRLRVWAIYRRAGRRWVL